MDNKIEQLLTDAGKAIHLDAAAKKTSRKHLEVFLFSNPIQDKTPVPHAILSLHTFLRAMPIVLIATLLLGGGLSLAAGPSLPGDTLYPMKVSITERVQSFLTLSDDAKNQLQVKFAERRLSEAEQLSAKARLEAKAFAKLEDRFQAHVGRTNQRIAELETEGDFQAAAQLSSKLEAVLKAHDRVLGESSSEDDDSREFPETEALHKRLKDTLNSTAQTRTKVEEKLSDQIRVRVDSNFLVELDDAKDDIKETREFVEDHEGEINSTASIYARAQLEIADNHIMQANAKFEADARGEAFILLQSALRINQEARAFVRAKINLRSVRDDRKVEKTRGPEGPTDPALETELRASGTGEIEVGF